MGARRQREIQAKANEAAQKQIEEFKLKEAAAQAKVDEQRQIYRDFQFQNPYAGLENVFEDLTVDQRAAQFQVEQGQQQRANIMQQMRGAAGTSGIAGLAQALAQQGTLEARQISTTISQQERQNQQLTAQAEMQLQQMEAGGEAAMEAAEFGREGTLLGMDYGELAGARSGMQQSYANEMAAGGLASQMQSARMGMWGDIIGGVVGGIATGGMANLGAGKGFFGGLGSPVQQTKLTAESCFMGDCKVKMFDGSIKPIKNIKTGDETVNIYGDKEIVANAIVHDINDVFSIYTDGTTKTTDKHPLFVNNKWTNAEILGWKHNSTFIDKLYNLEIKGTTKTFIIDNIIASGMVENETVNIDKI